MSICRPCEAVLCAAVEEGFQARKFLLRRGDDDFSADFVRDVVLPAEVDHLADAGDGETGFLGAGLVIQAGVQDAAIVSALMAADGGLFFEHGDAGVGEALGEAPGGGEADDSSADDYDLFRHLAACRTSDGLCWTANGTAR